MKIYLVTKEGIYNQGIVGAFTELEIACCIAEILIKRERDDYHTFHVSELELDAHSLTPNYFPKTTHTAILKVKIKRQDKVITREEEK